MDCAEAKLQIEPYVAGEIADDVKAALEEHLAGCAECRLDSELTRASKNTPVGPGPDAAPAAFVESIRPDGAEAASSDAAPAGEPPAGASQTPGGSWTLDSIFGAGGAGGAGAADGAAGPAGAGALKDGPFASSAASPADTDEDHAASAPVVPLSERAAAAAEPLPEHELALPAVFDGPEDRSADEPPESDAPTWDFEPADQKGAAKPPEGSLFFAEEALARSGTAAKKKSGMPRIVLWGAGGLLGVGLLALSIWIAMTVRQPLPPASITGHRTIRAETGPESPGAEAARTPVATEPTPSVATPPGNPGALNPAPTVTPPATGSTTPEGTRVTRGPDATTPGTASAASAPEPTVTTTRTTPTTSRAPTATPRTHAVTPPTRKPAPVQASASTSHGAATRTAPTLAPPATTKPAPAPPPVDDDWHETTPVWPVPQTMTPAPAAGSDAATSSRGGATRTGATTNSTGSANPSGATSGGSGAAEPPASTAGSSPAEGSSAETVNGPIDRLHLATLNAEQKADVVALRKLRDAWRGFVRTSIGPDRQRAKRELADCLWAVQTLTTKSSDQKEALAAYRDYVLNAPAGGADARTIARMRQLEDAVAESH